MQDPQHHGRRTRSSNGNPDPPACPDPATPTGLQPSNSSTAKPKESVATGFVDIYESLTPRQVGVISPNWIRNRNGVDDWNWESVDNERRKSSSPELDPYIDAPQPAALMISYTVVGFAVYLVLSALGEVAAWLPRPYTVADQAVRFCDPALGFSLGWIYWLKYAIVTPNQLTAAALVISYWLDAERVNPGVWITIFLLVITTLNYIHHRIPSQVEYFVSSFKLLIMSALMILSLVLALGGGPDREVRGFRYWKRPGAFVHRRSNRMIEKLFYTCGTMSSATFAYIGSERSGIVARCPTVQKAISRAIKHTFYRILVFHLLGVTLLGMLVPHDSISLAFYKNAARNAAASPFVVAVYLAGIAVVPDLLNGCILLFILSIANYDLYLATKALSDLSIKRRAPIFLSRINRRGVPFYALGISSSLATLAYLNVSHDSTMIFGYFVDMVTMLGLLTWISILITHVSFVRARRAQGIPDDALIFKARFGLPGTWLALTLCLFISTTMIFNAFSFDTGKQRFDYKSFVASYIGVPIYLVLYVGYKVALKSKHVDPKKADLLTDRPDHRRAVVELEEILQE
ncbi:Amino acid/polyamine transporter I [Penicillium macrosclerotiorum]|uniref:Amino acid/polyamine transporter I n=1 Tax=Penicillium macrosclerotiorum TaxID=303699 RepID=UPI0025488341|nr:Amino acid/polyamine transporter I [Penicillium macrosclerotiorum]KAJ5688902.1 Amino acid/polyamine transporter I [Penicillium macrosclerotiorum]